MTRRLIYLCLVVLFFTACINREKPTDRIINRQYKTEILESKKLLRDFLFTTFTPGLSVSVSYNNEIIWSEGLGLASKELNAPVSRGTKFRIGTTTYVFTAALLAKLHYQGLLNIDSSLYAYIPNYPLLKHDFSLRMLGVCSAGFRPTRTTDLQQYNVLRTLKEYVSTFENDELSYEPDTYFAMSDFGVSLLGVVAEQVTQNNYDKLLNEKIIEPLALKNTLFDNATMITPQRSDFYSVDYIARLVNAPTMNFSALQPVHGLLSTADDLNYFAQQLLQPGFFTIKELTLFSQKHKLKNGVEIGRSFGWHVIDDNNMPKIIASIGNTIGGSSAVVIYPDQKLVVTVCSNKAEELSELPANNIAKLFLKKLQMQADEKAIDEANEAEESAVEEQIEEFFDGE